MANLQKLIDLDGLSYFLGQIKAKFVRSVNGIKPDFKGNVSIANMEGATSNAAGKAGLVPIPATGKQDMALCGDATFKVLPIAGGGTGQTTAAGIRNALGLGDTTGALPVANGGTGANTVAAAVQALLGSSAVGSSTKSIYYDGKTLKACADSIGGGGIVAQLLEQNGYVKFANGLILQWGMFNTEWKGSNIVKFNISFAQICLTMFSTSITSDDYNGYGKIVSVSTTQFTHKHDGNAHPYFYFAIGY